MTSTRPKIRFLNCCQQTVQDEAGQVLPWHLPAQPGQLLASRCPVEGEPAYVIAQYRLLRGNGDWWNPAEVARWMQRVPENVEVQIDTEFDHKRPELWQTSVSHPLTDEDVLMKTVGYLNDFVTCWRSVRTAEYDGWYLLGTSPWMMNLNNTIMRRKHLQDQMFWRDANVADATGKMVTDVYRYGDPWEDEWYDEIIHALIDTNRSFWPTKKFCVSLCPLDKSGRPLSAERLRADLQSLCSRLRDGDCVQLWHRELGSDGETNRFDLSWPAVAAWNDWVREWASAA